MSGRVNWLTSKRVVCYVGNDTIYSPSPLGEGAGVRLHSRDRRPRLYAHLPLCIIPSGNIPSFGGAWGGLFWLCSGGQTRASVPTLWHPLG